MAAPSGPGQLPLPVTLHDFATFENFVQGDNTVAVEALRLAPAPIGNAFWLWGPEAVGKSHLLQALCAEHPSAAYLPAKQLVSLAPSALDGYERHARVCVDDVTALAGRDDWERALFRLYNRVTEAGGVTVVASRDNPRTAPLQLPDLLSRLRSGAVHRLQPLDDEARVDALQLRADLRGFELPYDTARYLITHYPRDFNSLCDMLDRLDLAVLATRRRLTIPFIKEALAADSAG